MACMTARRTRTSLNGLPLAAPNCSSARCWSKPRYCVPMSLVSTTLTPLSRFSRATSWNGGSMTKSTCPEASAARRVASDWMTT